MKRSNRLSYLKGGWHHPAFAVVIVLLTMHAWLGVLFGVFWASRLYRIDRRLFVFSLMVAAVFFLRVRFTTVDMPLGTTHDVRIVRVEVARQRAVVKSREGRFYAVFETLPDIRAGDTMRITGTPRSLEAPSLPGGFDYVRHLHALRIGGIFDVDEGTLMARGRSVHNIAEAVSQRIDSRFEGSGPYLRTYLLADRSAMREDFLDSASLLGISHLFAVSGLHVSLLCLMVVKAFALVGMKKQTADGCVVCLMVTYIVLTGFAPSIVRAGSMAVLLIANRRFALGFTAVDVCAALFVCIMLFHPPIIASTGFVLTFLIAFSILLLRPRLEKYGTVKQMFAVSALAFFVSLPIVSGFNHGFNPLTILVNVVFVAFAGFVLMPLVYLTFAFPFLEGLLTLTTTVFEQSVLYLGTHLDIRVRLHFSHLWMILVYIGLLYMVLASTTRRKRLARASALAVFVIFLIALPWLKPYEEVVFFHVHGDSIFVRDRHNRCNILIDTGETDTLNRLTTALKALHVTHLDYVLISHWHSDHYGELESVLSEFDVAHLVCNDTQQPYEGRTIRCGGIELFIYPLEARHRGENDRSMVLRLTIAGERILFTGDIEAPREATIIGVDLDATMLKVPHHGSSTSSSAAFLDAVTPLDAVITTHRNNAFGHPDDAVVERLHETGIRVHRTDVEGTIIFRYLFDRRFKITPFE